VTTLTVCMECGATVKDWTDGECPDSTDKRHGPLRDVVVAPVNEAREAAVLNLYHAANCLIGQADPDSTVATVLTPAVVAFENAALSSHEGGRNAD